jgi:ABC-type phosphate/phosphonate transport system substrate-binding protein
MTTALKLSYYPDITQYKSESEIRDAVVKFSSILEEDYSRKSGEKITIEVLPVVSVREQTQLMADGKCEIGLMKPVSYVLAQRENKAVQPVAVAWRLIDGKEGDTYFAQLYARAHSGVASIANIKRNHRIGFGDSFSTSNFLIPAAELLKEGIHPLTGFRKIEFFGGHDLTAKAVYLNETDIGAGHDGVIHLLSQVKGYEDANTKLKRIKRVDIHSDPVAVNAEKIPDFELFVKSLTDISEQDEVKKCLEEFWGNVTKLGPTSHSNYSSIELAIKSLNLKSRDILG